MTTLAMTTDHLVEFEDGYLTISRYVDGHCKAWKKKGIAGEFRDTLKKKGTEWTIWFYLEVCLRRAEWEPLYKPHCMPRGEDAEENQE